MVHTNRSIRIGRRWWSWATVAAVACGSPESTAEFSTEPVNTGVVGAPEESLLLCRGELAGVGLAEAGLDASELANGVRCVAADFDGNGSRDFVLYGDSLPENRARVFLAAFTDGDRVTRHFVFSHPGVADLVRYAPTGEEGPFGEPASAMPGLVQWGEGGSTFVFLFDPATQGFTVRELASESF